MNFDDGVYDAMRKRATETGESVSAMIMRLARVELALPLPEQAETDNAKEEKGLRGAVLGGMAELAAEWADENHDENPRTWVCVLDLHRTTGIAPESLERTLHTLRREGKVFRWGEAVWRAFKSDVVQQHPSESRLLKGWTAGNEFSGSAWSLEHVDAAVARIVAAPWRDTERMALLQTPAMRTEDVAKVRAGLTARAQNAQEWRPWCDIVLSCCFSAKELRELREAEYQRWVLERDATEKAYLQQFSETPGETAHYPPPSPGPGFEDLGDYP